MANSRSESNDFSPEITQNLLNAIAAMEKDYASMHTFSYSTKSELKSLNDSIKRVLPEYESYQEKDKINFIINEVKIVYDRSQNDVTKLNKEPKRHDSDRMYAVFLESVADLKLDTSDIFKMDPSYYTKVKGVGTSKNYKNLNQSLEGLKKLKNKHDSKLAPSTKMQAATSEKTAAKRSSTTNSTLGMAGMLSKDTPQKILSNPSMSEFQMKITSAKDKVSRLQESIVDTNEHKTEKGFLGLINKKLIALENNEIKEDQFNRDLLTILQMQGASSTIKNLIIDIRNELKLPDIVIQKDMAKEDPRVSAIKKAVTDFHNHDVKPYLDKDERYDGAKPLMEELNHTIASINNYDQLKEKINTFMTTHNEQLDKELSSYKQDLEYSINKVDNTLLNTDRLTFKSKL